MTEYPKYQLSKFLNGGRDYQVVIRTDDADELIEAMTKIKPLVEKIENYSAHKPSTPSNDVLDRYNTEEARICRNCGKGKMVKNPKTGKWFCADKCWLQVKPPQTPLKVEEVEEAVNPDDVPF